MASDAVPASGEGEAPRHASWLELFFDLIVVAGAGQLAHLLHGEPALSDVGLYGLLFLAFWIAWVLFTMYGNMAAERVRPGRVIVGMFGMVVMASAVAGVHDSEQKAVWFAVAYVYVRLLGAKFWGTREGRLAVDLPIAQYEIGLVPWIVSFWVPEDWRVWCWALGLALDVAILLLVSRADMERSLEQRWARFQQRFGHRSRGRPRRRAEDLTASEQFRPPRNRGRRAGGLPAKPVMVAADVEHLSERLGLFVIVVLGEGLIQIVTAASAIPWDGEVYFVGGSSFLILVSLWWLALMRGDNGLPVLRRSALPVRLSLVLHCLFTGAVVALSIVLGEAVTEAGTTLSQPQRVLASAAVGLCLLVLLVAAVASRESLGWVAAAVLPSAVVLTVLASLPDVVATVHAVPLLAAAVLWPVLLRAAADRRHTSG